MIDFFSDIKAILSSSSQIIHFTLLLQIALSLGKKVLYVSGEESEKQIKLRADRIQSNQENCYVLAETKTDLIGLQIEAVQPDLIIVDSVQTLQSPKLESASVKA